MRKTKRLVSIFVALMMVFTTMSAYAFSFDDYDYYNGTKGSSFEDAAYEEVDGVKQVKSDYYSTSVGADKLIFPARKTPHEVNLVEGRPAKPENYSNSKLIVSFDGNATDGFTNVKTIHSSAATRFYYHADEIYEKIVYKDSGVMPGSLMSTDGQNVYFGRLSENLVGLSYFTFGYRPFTGMLNAAKPETQPKSWDELVAAGIADDEKIIADLGAVVPYETKAEYEAMRNAYLNLLDWYNGAEKIDSNSDGRVDQATGNWNTLFSITPDCGGTLYFIPSYDYGNHTQGFVYDKWTVNAPTPKPKWTKIGTGYNMIASDNFSKPLSEFVTGYSYAHSPSAISGTPAWNAGVVSGLTLAKAGMPGSSTLAVYTLRFEENQTVNVPMPQPYSEYNNFTVLIEWDDRLSNEVEVSGLSYSLDGEIFTPIDGFASDVAGYTVNNIPVGTSSVILRAITSKGTAEDVVVNITGDSAVGKIKAVAKDGITYSPEYSVTFNVKQIVKYFLDEEDVANPTTIDIYDGVRGQNGYAWLSGAVVKSVGEITRSGEEGAYTYTANRVYKVPENATYYLFDGAHPKGYMGGLTSPNTDSTDGFTIAKTSYAYMKKVIATDPSVVPYWELTTDDYEEGIYNIYVKLHTSYARNCNYTYIVAQDSAQGNNGLLRAPADDKWNATNSFTATSAGIAPAVAEYNHSWIAAVDAENGIIEQSVASALAGERGTLASANGSVLQVKISNEGAAKIFAANRSSSGNNIIGIMLVKVSELDGSDALDANTVAGVVESAPASAYAQYSANFVDANGESIATIIYDAEMAAKDIAIPTQAAVPSQTQGGNESPANPTETHPYTDPDTGITTNVSVSVTTGSGSCTAILADIPGMSGADLYDEAHPQSEYTAVWKVNGEVVNTLQAADATYTLSYIENVPDALLTNLTYSTTGTGATSGTVTGYSEGSTSGTYVVSVPRGTTSVSVSPVAYNAAKVALPEASALSANIVNGKAMIVVDASSLVDGANISNRFTIRFEEAAPTVTLVGAESDERAALKIGIKTDGGDGVGLYNKPLWIGPRPAGEGLYLNDARPYWYAYGAGEYANASYLLAQHATHSGTYSGLTDTPHMKKFSKSTYADGEGGYIKDYLYSFEAPEAGVIALYSSVNNLPDAAKYGYRQVLSATNDIYTFINTHITNGKYDSVIATDAKNKYVLGIYNAGDDTQYKSVLDYETGVTNVKPGVYGSSTNTYLYVYVKPFAAGEKVVLPFASVDNIKDTRMYVPLVQWRTPSTETGYTLAWNDGESDFDVEADVNAIEVPYGATANFTATTTSDDAYVEYSWTDKDGKVTNSKVVNAFKATMKIKVYAEDGKTFVEREIALTMGKEKRNLSLDLQGFGIMTYKVGEGEAVSVEESTSAIALDKNSTITLEAIADEGHAFAYWVDGVSGRVISEEAVYTFDLVASKKVKAVFVPNAEGTKTYVFRNVNGRVLLDGYLAEGQFITALPANPTQMGYIFSAWYDVDGEEVDFGTAEAPKIGYSNLADGLNVFFANFELDPGAIYTLTLPEDAELVSPAEVGDPINLSYNEIVKVRAADKEGFEFKCWREGGAEGTIVSYRPDYGFYMSRNITLYAEYVVAGDTVNKEPIVSIAATYLEEGGVKKIAFFAERDLLAAETSFELLESGILITNDAEKNIDLNERGLLKSTSTRKTDKGQYLAKKPIEDSNTWYAKAYVVYKDLSGNIYELYSDKLTATYSAE